MGRKIALWILGLASVAGIIYSLSAAYKIISHEFAAISTPLYRPDLLGLILGSIFIFELIPIFTIYFCFMTYKLWKSDKFYERNKWAVISAILGIIIIVSAFAVGYLLLYSVGYNGDFAVILAFIAAQVVALIISAIGPLIDFVRRK